MVVGLPYIRQGGSELLGHIYCALLRSTVFVIVTLTRKITKVGIMRTFTVTFSKESGVSMAKAIKMTCDLEYDNGRKR